MLKQKARWSRMLDGGISIEARFLQRLLRDVIVVAPDNNDCDSNDQPTTTTASSNLPSGDNNTRIDPWETYFVRQMVAS